MSVVEYDPGSYRDRAGRVFRRDGEVYRGLRADALDTWRTVAAKPFYRELERDGKLVATTEVSRDLAMEWDGVLRHERVPVISYAYEWPFGMLRRAALLQLEVLNRALTDGVTLRDATTFNVQWIGARPVFIDVPSFALLAEGALWTGYRQFCEQFLYPLLIEAYKGIPFQPWLRGHIDGIDAEAASRLLMPSKMLRPGVLKHVYLHAALQRSMRARTSMSVAKEIRTQQNLHSRELIRANVRNLIKIVDGLRAGATSDWTEYEGTHSYSPEDRTAKEQFVVDALRDSRPRVTFDIGCNTGAFSEIAASHCEYVVGADSDPQVVERVFARGHQHILPMVWDLADPSPGLGWRGRERPPLQERLRPDLTLALALIHHLVLGRNILLSEVIEELAALGGDAVIEWVDRTDPMAARLLGRKDEPFDDYTLASFEEHLGRSYVIERKQPLASGSRILYFLRSRAGTRPR
jgi:SAM-dependent methyltransferase